MKKKELAEKLAYSMLAVYDLEIYGMLKEYFEGELRTLMYLNIASARECYPSDLAAAIGVTKQRITTIIASLKKKGFVETRKDEADKRRMIVEISEEGKAFMTEKEAAFWNVMNYIVDSLGEEESRELISQFRKFKKAVKECDK